ncbi:TSUP family transporter [Candidatus Marsarchaeota archaeon]|nr:TSUP family transporter [Candidatus Marsarchaeota archaeon]MCL5404237.1 TSUP family transporter [Candidatus Marsarchaeota archaeon]
MMLLYELAVFFIAALGISIIGNIVGIGGGVFLMVIFLFAFKLSPVFAGGLSLVTIIASTAAGSVFNSKEGAISRSLFYAVAIAASLGAIAGSVTSYFVPIKSFDVVFGAIIFLVGLFSLVSTRLEVKRNRSKSYIRRSFADYARSKASMRSITSLHVGKDVYAISFIAGIISGLFGIGIGGIMGTFLTAIKHVQPKVAFSTIVAAMIATSVVGAVVHFIKPGVELSELWLAVPLILGAVIGGATGAKVSEKINFTHLRSFQASVVMFFGALSLLIGLLSYIAA